MLKIKVQIREIKVNSLKRCRSEEHTSELQSPDHLVCRVLLEKKNRSADPIDDSRTAMHFLIPRIHAFKHFIALMERQLRPFFFFNDTATTEIYTLSLHDALPI